MDKLKLIKTIVVVITFLLVFGSLMLLTVIYKKARPTPRGEYIQISLQQPQGSTIDTIEALGNNLAILVKGGGQPDRIIIYNPQTKEKTDKLTIQDDKHE